MKQEEFINSFQEALAGKVSDPIIYENIKFYRNYIANETRNGKSEDEVLAMLGDPRLLAKTIEESNKFAQGAAYEEATEYSRGRNTQHRENGSAYERDQYAQGRTAQSSRPRVMGIPVWLSAILVIVVLAVVLVITFSLISFFAPIIIAAIAIAMIGSVIRSWGHRY